MRIRNNELELLYSIHQYLVYTDKNKLAGELMNLIDRLEAQREKVRKDNRVRARKNRASGYTWASSYHPSRSKYKEVKKHGN